MRPTRFLLALGAGGAVYATTCAVLAGLLYCTAQAGLQDSLFVLALAFALTVCGCVYSVEVACRLDEATGPPVPADRPHKS